MRRRIQQFVLVALVMLLAPCSMQAQEKSGAQTITVTGVVTDDSGEPLIGATVKVKGKNSGVSTDINGKYTITVARGSMLTFSYIGQDSKEMRVKSSTMNVQLTTSDVQLDQVVVTGYTQTDIRKSTGSVSIISGKELNDSPLKNVDMLLQGKLAGVNVTATSGRPGESAQVRVRGISSITGNNEPLWVVDGVPIQKSVPDIGSSLIRSGDFSTIYANGIAGISPQNIESVTVLKDASAAAIYGSQAQAGVIVITTKKGQQGRTRVSYDGTVSITTSPTRDASLMNSREKLAYEQSIWDEFSASGYANGTYYPRVGIVGQIRSGYGRFAGWSKEQQDQYINELGNSTTDWFKALFRNSVSTSHSVSVSGGSDKNTFFVSAGMNQNNGIVKRTNSDSYNFSAKINGTPLSNLQYSTSVDFSYLTALSPSQSFDIFQYAYFANPYEKLYNADGSYASDETIYSVATVNGDTGVQLPTNGINVMRELNETTLKNNSTSTQIRGDISWNAFKGFKLYGLAAFTFSNDNSDCEIGKNTYSAWTDRPFEGVASSTSKRIYGSLTQSANRNMSWLARIQANYTTVIARDHRVSAVAGSEVRHNESKSIYHKFYGYDPVTGQHVSPVYIGTKSDGSLTESEVLQYRNTMNSLSGQSRSKSAFASFYGALDYSYKDKYIANATLRSDGSNNFGSKQQFNYTWSAGLAWNIDEEEFMKSLKPIISRATVRLSTGLTGGVNKSVYPQIIMSYIGYRSIDIDTYRMGSISNAPNPNLRWEHTRDYNASLDLGLLNNRLNLMFSAYRRRGYDLVTSVSVVSTTGFSVQSYNTSEQINQGFELTVNATPLKLKDFSWSVTGNIAYNQNKLTKYEAPNNYAFSPTRLDYPLSSLFTGKYLGVDASNGLQNFALRPGASISSSADKRNMYNYVYYIGTENAPWTGGFSTHASYKNFSLSMSSTFALGAKKKYTVNNSFAYYGALSGTRVNSVQSSMSDLYTAHLNKPKEAANRWMNTNAITNGYPRLVDAYGPAISVDLDNVSATNITSGAEYCNAAYWKIGSISLMYSMPQNVIGSWGLTNLGFSLTANNVLTVTKFKGLDPESPGAVYPISRGFSFGVNVGF